MSSVTNFAGPAMLIAFCLCCSSSSLLLAGPFSGLFEILRSFFEVGGGVTGAASEAASAAASGAGDLFSAATDGLFGGSRSSSSGPQPFSEEQRLEIATRMQSSCFPCAPFGDEKCNETKTTEEQNICATVIDVTCTNDPSVNEYCPKYLEIKPSPDVTLDLSSSYTTASDRAERNRTYTAEECFQCIPLTTESRGGIECNRNKIKACKETVTDTCRAGIIDQAYRRGCRTFNKMASKAASRSPS